MFKKNLIVLLGLCFAFSSTLYGAQQKSLSGDNPSSSEKSEVSASDSSGQEYATSFTSFESDSSTDTLTDIWDCKSLKGCKALTKIVCCVKHWQKINSVDKPKSTSGAPSLAHHYRDIISAYHHLLEVHLHGPNSRGAYQLIHHTLRAAVACNFTTCKAYMRNQRDRRKANHTVGGNNDKEEIFVRDLLDTIHAYLVHGCDSGHRYITKAKGIEINSTPQKPQMHPSKMQRPQNVHNGLFFDLALQKLQTWQEAIKKQRRNLNRHAKFQTKAGCVAQPISLDILAEKFGHDKRFKLWIQYLAANECDTDNVLAQIAGDDDPNEHVISVDTILCKQIQAYVQQQRYENKKTGRYNFGLRLYYWDYYKNAHKKDVNWQAGLNYNPGYQQKDLYVASAYLSLKNELLAKKGITIGYWDQKYYEAGALLAQSQPLKKLRAGGLSIYYNIQKHSTLSRSHVLSLLFYTNFTALCSDFSASFRYQSPLESVQDVIKRNTQWHYLSKYLREAVEVFGTKIGQDAKGNYCDRGSFYHGVAYLLFSESGLQVCGPLSTSTQLEVALLFTNKEGLVVELKQAAGFNNKHLRFFNASFVSCFTQEEECLFIGGQYPMQIASVRVLKAPNMNTGPLMHTLFAIDKMIKGETCRDVTSKDKRIFEKLIYGAKKLPCYAQQIWGAFQRKQQEIKIDIFFMYRYYSLFLPLLLVNSTKVSNVLWLDRIVALFPNVKQIVCEEVDCIGMQDNGWEGMFVSGIVGLNFMLCLSDRLRQIEKNSQPNKLQQIVVKTAENKVSGECTLLAKQLGTLGWEIQKENEKKLNGTIEGSITLQKIPHALISKVSLMLAGESLRGDKVRQSDVAIFKKLIANAPDIPLQGKKIWTTFSHKQQTITIDMEYMYQDYKLFFPVLFSSSITNLLRLDKLVGIFPNISKVVCKEMDRVDNAYYDFSSRIVGGKFIAGLKHILRSIGKNKCSKLKKIIIATYRKKIKCALPVAQFGALGWQLETACKTYEDSDSSYAASDKDELPKQQYVQETITLTRILGASTSLLSKNNSQ